MNEILCTGCHLSVFTDWYYCPNCGKTLKVKPIVVSIGKQIFIYLVSFFFAPLGLMWGIKYVRNSDKKTRIVGLVSIVLTLLALGLTIYGFSSIMGKYTNMLNGLGNGIYTPIY